MNKDESLLYPFRRPPIFKYTSKITRKIIIDTQIYNTNKMPADMSNLDIIIQNQ